MRDETIKHLQRALDLLNQEKQRFKTACTDIETSLQDEVQNNVGNTWFTRNVTKIKQNRALGNCAAVDDLAHVLDEQLALGELALNTARTQPQQAWDAGGTERLLAVGVCGVARPLCACDRRLDDGRLKKTLHGWIRPLMLFTGLGGDRVRESSWGYWKDGEGPKE